MNKTMQYSNCVLMGYIGNKESNWSGLNKQC